jgi:hypothetical protein
VELTQEDKLIEDLHLLVKPALFRQVADLVQLLRSNGLPNRLIWPESGTVMPIIMRMVLVFPARCPEKAKHAALLNAEREIVDRTNWS